MFRYTFVGLSKATPKLDLCPEPPCSTGTPGISEGDWASGSKTLKGTWKPKFVAAVDFHSEEIAMLWLTKTKEGKKFKEAYTDLVLVRTHE